MGAAFLQTGDGLRCPIQTNWLAIPAPILAYRRRRNSGEAACYVKEFLLLQNGVVRSRQFVRQRFGGDDIVGLGFLAGKETSGFFTVATREVGGFDDGPAEIFVAVLGVAFAFLLPVLARSRTARCSGGNIVPVGRMPRRSRWAR